MFNVAAISRRLFALSDQLAMNTAMWSSFQNHLRMFAEGNARICVFVLGTNSEDHASPAQVQKEALQRDMRFAYGAVLTKGYAVEAVIADDAAPQSVVEIQYQAFARLATRRAQEPANVVGIKRGRIKRRRQLSLVPSARVVPAIQSYFAGEECGIDDEIFSFATSCNSLTLKRSIIARGEP